MFAVPVAVFLYFAVRSGGQYPEIYVALLLSVVVFLGMIALRLARIDAPSLGDRLKGLP